MNGYRLSLADIPGYVQTPFFPRDFVSGFLVSVILLSQQQSNAYMLSIPCHIYHVHAGSISSR